MLRLTKCSLSLPKAGLIGSLNTNHLRISGELNFSPLRECFSIRSFEKCPAYSDIDDFIFQGF